MPDIEKTLNFPLTNPLIIGLKTSLIPSLFGVNALGTLNQYPLPTKIVFLISLKQPSGLNNFNEIL